MTPVTVSANPWQAFDAPYVASWACRESEPLQRALDALYEYENDPETQVLHRSRLNLFDRVMRRLDARGAFPRKARALDLGCNAGYYSKLISDYGFARVDGIDIDAGAIDRARRVFGTATRRFEVANAEQLEAPGEYDFILCTEVIEHTAHPQEVLRRMSDALVPGGIAWVTLPNAVSVAYGWARLAHALARRPIDPMLREHLSFPFYRSLHAFEPYGLWIREVHATNLLLPQPLISALHRTPGFGLLHRASAALAIGPFKYVSQFLCLVLEKPGRSVRATPR